MMDDEEYWSEYEIYGSTLIGPPSKKRGKPNQDYYGHGFTPQGDVILVAADGAGSLQYSDEGSQRAVETILNTASQTAHTDFFDILEEAVENAREELLALENYREYGCTLAVAVMGRDSYAVSITGDAFAVVDAGGDGFLLHQNPQVGEYANITKLLTSSDSDTTMYSSEGTVQGIAVSTDGLAHTTIDNSTETPTYGFWSPVFSKAFNGDLDIDSLFEYMYSLAKIDDDTTLVVAVRPRD